MILNAVVKVSFRVPIRLLFFFSSLIQAKAVVSIELIYRRTTAFCRTARAHVMFCCYEFPDLVQESNLSLPSTHVFRRENP